MNTMEHRIESVRSSALRAKHTYTLVFVMSVATALFVRLVHLGGSTGLDLSYFLVLLSAMGLAEGRAKLSAIDAVSEERRS